MINFNYDCMFSVGLILFRVSVVIFFYYKNELMEASLPCEQPGNRGLQCGRNQLVSHSEENFNFGWLYYALGCGLGTLELASDALLA